jgi:hypothetical protein
MTGIPFGLHELADDGKNTAEHSRLARPAPAGHAHRKVVKEASRLWAVGRIPVTYQSFLPTDTDKRPSVRESTWTYSRQPGQVPRNRLIGVGLL